MFKLDIMYNQTCLNFLTNFHHCFDEHIINDTLEVNTQQYIMNVLGTAICVCIALNTVYYKHMVSIIQHQTHMLCCTK